MPTLRHEVRKAVELQRRAHESWRKSADPATHPGLRTHHQESSRISYYWARRWMAGHLAGGVAAGDDPPEFDDGRDLDPYFVSERSD